MPSFLADHIPIAAVSTVSGNQPRMETYLEDNAETFVEGTPVQLTAGVCLEWDGITIPAGILGFAAQNAKNLASDGLGAPPAFGSVAAPGVPAGSIFEHPINQPSANIYTPGSPMSDGRVGVYIGNDDTLFLGQVDGNTAADYTLVQADIGASYGMTKDASGHWYVDLEKVGGDACVQIVAVWPPDGLIANARVLFKVLRASQQLA